MKICIEGIGIVGGFGAGIKEFSKALATGGNHVQSVPLRVGENVTEIPAFLADTSHLNDFIPKKALRRIDHYAKMALLGSYLALQDASMMDIDPKLGIVVASGYGASATTFAFLDSFITSNDTFSSPTHFSNSVHNTAAAQISILLGTIGPCLTVSQFEMSVPSALITAINWLKEGRVEKVLFGAVDEYCDVLGYCYHRFFGLNQAIEPFLFDRQTAIPGEGSAFFLLSMKEPSGKTYGHITSVAAEYRDGPGLPLPHKTLFILGADGHGKYGRYYEQCVTSEMNITSYTSLFGSFPTNTAFDMAVACLSLKGNKVYSPPSWIIRPAELTIPDGTDALDASEICCFKMGNHGESGVITLKKD
ncbi:MAG: beta-ketoacyl synthase chain length factor [Syntrophobacterales bacterium]|jgi:3-oxoacyl-[acyl-carrier-protein] synthase II|nr:beta-ketoacyl synthase chain length factor [Syntrophobacterales bacterium]